MRNRPAATTKPQRDTPKNKPKKPLATSTDAPPAVKRIVKAKIPALSNKGSGTTRMVTRGNYRNTVLKGKGNAAQVANTNANSQKDKKSTAQRDPTPKEEEEEEDLEASLGEEEVSAPTSPIKFSSTIKMELPTLDNGLLFVPRAGRRTEVMSSLPSNGFAKPPGGRKRSQLHLGAHASLHQMASHPLPFSSIAHISPKVVSPAPLPAKKDTPRVRDIISQVEKSKLTLEKPKEEGTIAIAGTLTLTKPVDTTRPRADSMLQAPHLTDEFRATISDHAGRMSQGASPQQLPPVRLNPQIFAPSQFLPLHSHHAQEGFPKDFTNSLISVTNPATSNLPYKLPHTSPWQSLGAPVPSFTSQSLPGGPFDTLNHQDYDDLSLALKEKTPTLEILHEQAPDIFPGKLEAFPATMNNLLASLTVSTSNNTISQSETSTTPRHPATAPSLPMEQVLMASRLSEPFFLRPIPPVKPSLAVPPTRDLYASPYGYPGYSGTTNPRSPSQAGLSRPASAHAINRLNPYTQYTEVPQAPDSVAWVDPINIEQSDSTRTTSPPETNPYEMNPYRQYQGEPNSQFSLTQPAHLAALSDIQHTPSSVLARINPSLGLSAQLPRYHDSQFAASLQAQRSTPPPVPRFDYLDAQSAQTSPNKQVPNTLSNMRIRIGAKVAKPPMSASQQSLGVSAGPRVQNLQPKQSAPEPQFFSNPGVQFTEPARKKQASVPTVRVIDHTSVQSAENVPGTRGPGFQSATGVASAPQEHRISMRKLKVPSMSHNVNLPRPSGEDKWLEPIRSHDVDMFLYRYARLVSILFLFIKASQIQVHS